MLCAHWLIIICDRWLLGGTIPILESFLGHFRLMSVWEKKTAIFLVTCHLTFVATGSPRCCGLIASEIVSFGSEQAVPRVSTLLIPCFDLLLRKGGIARVSFKHANNV